MQKKTKKGIQLVAAVSMALLGMSYGMIGQVEAYGTAENPGSYDSYKATASSDADTKDIYVAKYSEKNGSIEGISDFQIGAMRGEAVTGIDSNDAKGQVLDGDNKETQAKVDGSKAGSVTAWGLYAENNGLSHATITIGDKNNATEITGGKDSTDPKEEETSVKDGAKGVDKGATETTPGTTTIEVEGDESTTDPTRGGDGGDGAAGAAGGDATGYGIVLGKGSDVAIHVINNEVAKNEFIVTGGKGGDGGDGGAGGSGQSFADTNATTQGGRGGDGGDGGAGSDGGAAKVDYIAIKNTTGIRVDLNYDDAKRDTQTDIKANGGNGGNGGEGGQGGAGGTGGEGGQGGDAGDGGQGGKGGEASATGMTFAGVSGLEIHGDGFNVSAYGGEGGAGGDSDFGGQGGITGQGGAGGNGGNGGDGGKATATALTISNAQNVTLQIDTISANATGGNGGNIGSGGGSGDDRPSSTESQVDVVSAAGDTSGSEESKVDDRRGKAGEKAGNGGSAEAKAVHLDGVTGKMTVESITATATAGKGGKDTQPTKQQIGTNGTLAHALALDFKNTTMEVLGDKDVGNGITIRAEAANASGEKKTEEDDSTGNTKSSTSSETGAAGNVAVAIHQDGGAISYIANGKFAVSAEAEGDGCYTDGTTEKTASYMNTESDAFATAMELAGGKTTIEADEVALSAISRADRDGLSAAYTVHVTKGGNLAINAVAGDDSKEPGGITIKASSDAGSEENESKGIGRAVGISNMSDADDNAAGAAGRDTITLITDGKASISAVQKNENADKDEPPTETIVVVAENAADETASVAYAVELSGADLTIDALNGIEISAANAAATKAGEYALKAEDSTVTLYGGKGEDPITFNGNVELSKNSTMTLRSSASTKKAQVVESAEAAAVTTTGQGKGDLSLDASTLILQEDAEELKVAGNMDVTGSKIYFYDDTNPDEKYIGVESNPAYEDFRKIDIITNLNVQGENELFIRSNSLSEDVSDWISVTGKVEGQATDGKNAKVNITVFDEGMKTGYDGKKDGKGWDGAEPETAGVTFDGKALDNEITVISSNGTSNVDYTAEALAYDNGVWAYEYDVDVDVKDGKNVVLTQVATTSAKASAAQKTAVDGNIAAASAAVSFFGADETLHERLGDLRAAKGDKENGIWAKYIGGRLSADGMGRDVKVKYNGVEIGYDHALGNNWTVGVAGEYIDGDTTLTSGNGNVKTKAGALYGTWLGDKGHHLDIIAKVGKVDSETHSFGGTISKQMDGDFDANAYSLSVEYGRKYDVANDWFVTPAARLSYVHMGSASYNVKALNNTMHAKNDSFDSFILRAGARVGKKLSGNGSFYFKLAALYDFDGDMATTISADGRSATYEKDLGGFGLEYGVGFDKSFGHSSLYFDLERISGGDLEKDWGVNVGFRYQF